MVGADYLTLAQVPAQTFMQGLAEEIAVFLSMEVRLRSSLQSGDAAIAINGQRFRPVMIHLCWLLRRWLPCSEIVMHISDAESPPKPEHLRAGAGSQRSLEIEVSARSNAIIAGTGARAAEPPPDRGPTRTCWTWASGRSAMPSPGAEDMSS